MKRSTLTGLLAAITIFLGMGCGDTGSGFAGLASEVDSLSYAIGMDLGKNFSSQDIEISAAALKQGIEDQLGGTALLDEAQIQTIMQAFQRKMEMKQREAMTQKSGEANFVALLTSRHTPQSQRPR